MTTGQYTDWYGAGMAVVWHFLWRITGSYASLYVLNMTLYWTLITVMVWRVEIGTVSFWMILLAGVFFCFIPQYIMRDSLAALLWGIAVLLLLHRRAVLVAFLLLGLGLWIRTNTLAGLLPLVWMGRRKIWWSLAITAFMLIAVQFLTYKVAHATRAYPEYKLKLLDIAGISKRSGRNYFPEAIREYPAFHYDTLLQRYTPSSVDDLYWPPYNRPSMIPRPNAALNEATLQSWLGAVKDHPLWYLQNRLEGYVFYLRLRKRFDDHAYWNVFLSDRFGRVYRWFDATPLYAPWFWLLLNTIGFFYFLRVRKDPMAACIQLSGILFLLSQLLVYQWDREFRYSYWNVITVLAGIHCLLEKRRGYRYSPG